jgi:phenol 2-monooxygenase (NADPH)
VQHGRYTAGTATQYKPALLTGDTTHQQLATGFKVGTRLHSAPVIRIGDGRQVQLGDTLAADGRWRLIAFAGAGDNATADSPVGKLCSFLLDGLESPLKLFTPAEANVDAVFDVRGVFQQSHHSLAVTAMPELLFPKKGLYGLRDYEKAFCALEDAKHNIYTMRNINKAQGCLVVVRPDQYIAQVMPLSDSDALAKFFASFMLRVQ